MASRQHRETIEIPAGRGTIYDRTGEPLAIGEQATTVYADPRNVARCAARRGRRRQRRSASTRTSSTRSFSDRTKGFVYVERKADPVKAADAAASAVSPGLGFYPEELRTYPQGPVAAHVLGFAGTDNHGLDGLERSLDKTLAGRPGFETIVSDPFGRAIDVVTSRAERPGRNVDADDRPPDPGERRADPRRARVQRWRREGGDRDRDGSAHAARSSRWRTPRRSTRTASRPRPPRRARNRAVTDATSPARRSRSSRSRRRSRTTSSRRRRRSALPPTIQVADRVIHEAHIRGTERMTRQQILSRVVERRHDHDRREARRRASSPSWIDRFGFGKQTGRRLPGREPGHRAAAREVVGLDDRHRADRAGHRGDAAADGVRVRDDRQRRRARARRTSSRRSAARRSSTARASASSRGTRPTG